jgi:hypothetical protein
MRSRRVAPLLAPSLVFIPRRFAKAAHVGCLSYKLYRLFQTQHSFSVTIFTLGFRLFYILLQINLTNRHLDTAIANAILKKGTHNSYGQWPKQDYDMAVTMLQMPHVMVALV